MEVIIMFNKINLINKIKKKIGLDIQIGLIKCSNFCDKEGNFIKEPLIQRIDSWLMHWNLLSLLTKRYKLITKITVPLETEIIRPLSDKYIKWWMKKNDYIWSDDFYDINCLI
jgi:hypothetical protein